MSLHPTLNYTVTAADVLHVCPYDKSHQVLAPRLCRHLSICRKAYLKKCGNKEPDIQICRWNSNHHHASAQIQTHEAECPDRETMTDFVRYHADPNWKLPGPSSVRRPDEVRGSEQVTKFEVGKKGPLPTNLDKEEESWEPKPKPKEVSLEENFRGPGPSPMAKDDTPDTVYDPAVRLMREALIYNPQGLTKSERKAHRQAEHERWKKLKSNPMVDQTTLGPTPEDPEPEPEGAAGGKVEDEREKEEDWDSEESFPETDSEDEEED